MAAIRKNELAALHEALKKCDAFIAAASGEESTCVAFEPNPWRENFSEEQRQSVRLYVDTWIRTPLAAAIEGIEGSRDFGNEAYLRGIDTGRWF